MNIFSSVYVLSVINIYLAFIVNTNYYVLNNLFIVARTSSITRWIDARSE